MNYKEVAVHISDWLNSYRDNSGLSGFVVGISGGVDSALTSTLCAKTGEKTILVSMPIRQSGEEYSRAVNHISDLASKFSNVQSFDINLTTQFEQFESTMPFDIHENKLAMANSRARLRMTTLYAIAQANNCLVVGTGNKVEDFGIGFFTKYGDGGVDISPIADLLKTDVWEMAKKLGVITEIIEANPTDGLFEDGKIDEERIGANYEELEWAMEYKKNDILLSERQKTVLEIYSKLNRINKHKIEAIPVCKIPLELK